MQASRNFTCVVTSDDLKKLIVQSVNSTYDVDIVEDDIEFVVYKDDADNYRVSAKIYVVEEVIL